MSPHTDAGAFTIRLEARPADDSHDWVEIYPAQLQWMAKEGNQVRAIEVAASHGSAGAAQASWQSIETAPLAPERDPPLVMLWVDDGGHGGNGTHAFGRCYRSHDGTVRGVASGFHGNWSVRYWQPLPAGPSVPSAHQPSPRAPKVRTSHHRNKEEAARLQALVDKRYVWPAGCHDPDSCARHFGCMYVQCPNMKKDGNDLAAEIRASVISSTHEKAPL